MESVMINLDYLTNKTKAVIVETFTCVAHTDFQKNII